MGKKYSGTFKNRAIEKALSRGDGVSILQIANDIGVARGTLYHWIGKSHKTAATRSFMPEKRPQDWCEAEKLQAIIEAGPMDEENLNSYCRRNGIYKHHIEQWKADMTSTKPNPDKAENKVLRLENKQLKKELQRKEKALAEAAAIIILQKKVKEIWGCEVEED